MRSGRRGRGAAAAFFVSFSVLPLGAAAQVATLWGLVRAESGKPVAGVVVTLDGVRVAVGDTTGSVRFAGVPPGPHVVWLRGIGWRPVTLAVNVPRGRDVVRFSVNLRPLPIRLETLEIVADAGSRRLAREGFFERRDLGFGHFITRAEIVRLNPQRTSRLLATLPPRFRGSCALWIDGVPAQTRGDILRAVDLLITPGSIAGIEMYSGGANTPMRFNVARGPCSVVVWTR